MLIQNVGGQVVAAFQPSVDSYVMYPSFGPQFAGSGTVTTTDTNLFLITLAAADVPQSGPTNIVLYNLGSVVGVINEVIVQNLPGVPFQIEV